VANDIISKSGTWFSYNENRIGQGRENSKRFLSENLELSAEIEERLRKTLGLVPSEGNLEEGTEELPTKGKKAEKNS
jgi:recombination protein RecA